MKKVLIMVAIVVVIYFLLVDVLTATGVCPKYINMMPRVIELGTENVKGPNDPQIWHAFCSFAEKVY